MDRSKKKPNNIPEFFIKSLNGMALGLFSTLIVGTILGTIGYFFSLGAGNKFCDFIVSVIGNNGKGGLSFLLQVLTGAGIGIGIALSLKFDILHAIVIGIVGEIASYYSLSIKFVNSPSFNIEGKFQIGDPLTIYIVCILVSLIFKYLVSKKSISDILLVPLIGTISGFIITILIRYPTIYVTYAIQWIVNYGTEVTPLLMGIIVAVVMGMALTAPISSAAIAAMIFTINDEIDYSSILSSNYKGLALASGAAVVGCCTQMIGFMIQSRKDNKKADLLSIGIGTSMLQFKNIIRKPVIWLPTIIVSAILGPISTCLVNTVCLGSSAGMGTAGLIGIIGTILSMGVNNWRVWISIIGLELLGPAILVFLIDLLFRKLHIIKEGDLKL